MKKCCTCKKEKEVIAFGKLKGSFDGYRSQCKECRNVRLRTGKPNLGRIKKGNVPWNKGKYTSAQRKSPRHDNWSKQVRDRDGNQCTKCGVKENLHAHHIIPWKENVDLRFDVNNGITLCGRCHCKIEPKLPKNQIAWNKGIKGTHFSLQTEIKPGQRISIETEFKKGMIPWNKGKSWSKEMKEKLSVAHRGQHSSSKTEFKKGMIPWNKGKKNTDETKRKISETKRNNNKKVSIDNVIYSCT